MITLNQHRAALYDKLPPELADLCRAVRELADLKAKAMHDNAEGQLDIVLLLAERARRWEDRQLRLQLEAKEAAATPKRRLRRRAKPTLHLRLVK